MVTSSSVKKSREDIYGKLSQDGCRWTRPRQSVLEVFIKNDMPMTVAEVHKKLASSTVDLVSVYRTINLFCRYGVLVPVDSIVEGKRFELSDSYREHHHHLICQVCGKIEDYAGCFAKKIQNEIMRKTKFIIKSHDFKFFGLCGLCQN